MKCAVRSVIALVALVLGACAAPSSTRTHFYDLSAEAPVMETARESPAGAAAGATAPTRVSVWQVSVPEMVDRSQMVIRLAPNRVEIADFHRWAEPLKRAIPRVLAEDLGRLLGPAYAVAAGQTPGAAPEVRVTVEVRRFDAVVGEGVTVEASWSVRPSIGEARSGRSLVEERSQGADHATIAAAFSRALARLSKEIASALR